jgi:Na+/H+ antiporter NhaD/arsenite permease-like protein
MIESGELGRLLFFIGLFIVMRGVKDEQLVVTSLGCFLGGISAAMGWG